MAKNFTEESEELFLVYLISSEDLFTRCRTIIQVDYFSKRFKNTVIFILKYVDTYSKLPTDHQIKVETGVDLFTIPLDKIEKTTSWFLTEFEKFCKHKAMERALYLGTDHWQKGNYDAVEQIIKESILVGLPKPTGLNLFNDPTSFLERLKNKDNMVKTGWDVVDEKLYGGFDIGGLNIFAGAPGTGKSCVLQNLALNWVEMGKNVVYITLELSEDLVGLRMLAMVSGSPSRDIIKHDVRDVGLMVKNLSKKNNWGELIVKFMPLGTKVNDIKSYLKEKELQDDRPVDAVLVDYLDLLHPNSRKVSPSDLFVKDKYISEEMRALGQEKQFLLATASQLNRQSMEEREQEMHHIAGGISKINTADNVMAIISNNSLKERGEIQFKFIKTRSSSGVGQWVSLSYCKSTMRIGNMEQQESEEEDPSALTQSIKRKSKRDVEEHNQNKKKVINKEEDENKPEPKKSLRELVNRLS